MCQTTTTNMAILSRWFVVVLEVTHLLPLHVKCGPVAVYAEWLDADDVHMCGTDLGVVVVKQWDVWEWEVSSLAVFSSGLGGPFVRGEGEKSALIYYVLVLRLPKLTIRGVESCCSVADTFLSHASASPTTMLMVVFGQLSLQVQGLGWGELAGRSTCIQTVLIQRKEITKKWNRIIQVGLSWNSLSESPCGSKPPQQTPQKYRLLGEDTLQDKSKMGELGQKIPQWEQVRWYWNLQNMLFCLKKLGEKGPMFQHVEADVFGWSMLLNWCLILEWPNLELNAFPSLTNQGVLKGTELRWQRAQNADFRRKPQIFADSPLLLEIQAFGEHRKRRKPQIRAEKQRCSQKTAGNRRLGSVTLGLSLEARPQQTHLFSSQKRFYLKKVLLAAEKLNWSNQVESLCPRNASGCWKVKLIKFVKRFWNLWGPYSLQRPLNRLTEFDQLNFSAARSTTFQKHASGCFWNFGQIKLNPWFWKCASGCRKVK